MKKIRKHIPDDLAIYILSKLPLKSLKRFGCVCKSWALLFENPYFINNFRNNFLSNHRSSYNDTSLLLLQSVSSLNSFLFSLPGERFQNNVKLEWPNPFQYDVPPFHFLGFTSVNGILCLYNHSRTQIVLWNPTIGDSKVIPPSPIEIALSNHHIYMHLFGFGYDCVRDDYKLIRHSYIYPISDGHIWGEFLPDLICEIYSLRSNSWKKLDYDTSTLFNGHYYYQLYLDGMCHVLTLKKKKFEVYVMSFDLNNEVFITTLCPSDVPSHMYDDFDFYDVKRAMVILNGCIALISDYADILYISVLGDPGVKESWTKLFVIQHLSSCIEYSMGAGKMGDIFFTTKDGGIACLDLRTHMLMEDTGIKGCMPGSQIVIYKESLLSLKE